MKHTIYLFGFLCLTLFTGCQNQVQQVTGSYSYKISGRGIVHGEERVLENEIGAMDIIRSTDSTALVTFTALRGPACHTYATIQKRQIVLDAFERDVTFGTADYHVTASGSGTIYENTIIICLKYEGTILSADSLELLCKRN